MKKFILPLLISGNFLSAQFKITAEVPATVTDKEAYLYTYNGSKSILAGKGSRTGNRFSFNYPSQYRGFMRLYLPENNYSVNFVSENSNVDLKVVTNSAQKISGVEYLDNANKVMDQAQNLSEKKTKILPALVQIREFYKPTDEFATALGKEISRLSDTSVSATGNYPFITYFNNANTQYLSPSVKPTGDQIIDFIVKSNEYLETSSLMRPLLLAYLNNGSGENTDQATDKLLDAVNLETPRGQTVLSEMIDIFDAYGLEDAKARYLSRATNLKCTINDRLAETIKKNKSTEMGAIFPDYAFTNAKNTTAKSIKGVKADKKIIVFWSSTCSHCEAELPQLLEKYRQMKQQNVEIIGLSMDSDKASYEAKAAMYPWINDAEMKGWNSSYSDTYNVHATPTYFVLDANNKILAKPEHATDVLGYFNLK